MHLQFKGWGFTSGKIIWVTLQFAIREGSLMERQVKNKPQGLLF